MAIPQEMMAVVVAQPGGPEVLVPERRRVPLPGPDEVLVRVMAAGVNRPDVLQRQGAYPPPPGAPDIPGLEVSGEVLATGGPAGDSLVGSRVTALVAGGGYAEYCTAPVATALPWPEGLDAVAAAALPETFFTVWSNVFDRAALKDGEVLLVHGGASGIGTTAVQLGRAFGARVFATAGTADGRAACLRLGAERAIDYRTEDFVAVVKSATDGYGADVILDMVGGDYVARNYEAAAVGGRIVQIATLSGARAIIDVARLMTKRLVHTGSTLRPRDLAFKGAIAASLRREVWPLLSAGSVAPVIDSIFPLGDAAGAHRRIEDPHVGKVMLSVG